LNTAFQTLIALSGDKIKSSKLLTTTIPLDNYVQLKRVLRVFFNEKSKTLYLRQYLGHITRDKDAKNFFGKAFKINQHLDTLDGYFYLINQLDGAFLQLESQDPHIGENRTLSTFLLRMSEKAKKKKSKIGKKLKKKEIDDILLLKKQLDSTSSSLQTLRHVVAFTHTCAKCGDSFSRYEEGNLILINSDLDGRNMTSRE